MMRNILFYEVGQSLRHFGIWCAVSLGFAIAARIGWFSLTDLPLFFLMFFGMIAIVLFRYHKTMYGREAAFMFTVPISPAKQVAVRLGAVAIWCAICTAMMGVALLLQGEDIGTILLSLPPTSALLLFLEVSLSAYLLIILMFLVITLTNLNFCKKHRVIWMCIWTCIIAVAFQTLSSATSAGITNYIVISNDGVVTLSPVSSAASSITFSINSFVWQLVCVPVYVGLTYYRVRRKLIIEY